MSMKFTTVAADAFQKLQLNAGILLSEFDPTTQVVDRTKILGATSGGNQFTATPTYSDFGEDIDNVPANTKELKRLESVEAKMSGTFKTADEDLTVMLIAAADKGENGRIIPRDTLSLSDFNDIWWVGDYSDVNSGTDAGFIAIHLMNALSNTGFSLKPNDKGKGEFAYEFVGHYSLSDVSQVPYEIWVVSGTDTDTDATLYSLSISDAVLSPTFASGTTSYTATTSESTSTVTAVANDNDASLVITVNGNSIASGGTATWATGSNTVVITVDNSGVTKTYKVVVTKS